MRTWAIVHLERFLGNINAVKTRIGHEKRICVPVKADAYGHGALEIAKTSLKTGISCFSVATVREGTELRKGGIKEQILLFSQPHPEEIPELISSDLTPIISDEWYADALNKQAKSKLSVHMKIDTGMGRFGCPAEEALALARHISSCPKLELKGTSTHFAVSDSENSADTAYTQHQLSGFKDALNTIKSAGIDPGIIHAANSGAVLRHPDTWFDMVRPGILLYGYKTTEENGEPLMIQSVMELRTIVVLIKKLKKSESISYGRTWTASQDTFIAVLPVGYADGFPRLASNKWQTVIGGKSYPLAGRVCMDQCCVDLGTESEVKRWDEAVIFGGTAADASALAAVTGTIPYEITSNINKRVPRIYTNG
ncbi:MAG: alanine racemase [Treponema sp.]|nr:alanine racemase [Treponema sp.]MCL2272454.1 alanine racemase [Treponema sp.]